MPSTVHSIVAVLAICVLASTGNLAGAGDTAVAQASHSGFDLTEEVVIERLSLSLYHTVVDLGELPVGTHGKIHLDLVNNFDLDFPVTDLSASKPCTSASFKKKMIAANSTARLELALETPRTARKSDQSFQIRLVSGRGQRHDVTFAIRYRLAGLIAFGEAMVSHQVGESVERQQLVVPFALTRPMDTKQVSIEISPPNDGVLARLASDDSGSRVIIDIEPVFIQKEGFVATIHAKDAEDAIVDRMLLSLYRVDDVELSPRTLIFRKGGEKAAAEGILCLHQVEDQPLGDRIPSISAKLGKLTLAVDCTKIGKGIYRVRVISSAENLARQREDSDADSRIAWHIVTASRSVESHSRVHFSSSLSTPNP